MILSPIESIAVALILLAPLLGMLAFVTWVVDGLVERVPALRDRARRMRL